MAEEFDPYRKWLGIPPKDQPPNHYRLLGIAHFEDDPDVIENAAARQMAHVRTFQSGKHGSVSQRILNELTTAKLCLLQAAKKQIYDASLHEQLAATGQLSSEGVLDAAVEEVPVDIPQPPPSDFRPNEGRWRTSQETEYEFPTPGPAPVPIPMPPTVPPPVATSSSLSGAQKIRRTGYAASASRPRKPSSAMPMLLIFGAVTLLGLAIVVAVMMSLNGQTPPPNHAKPPERPTTKRPNPQNSGNNPNTPFTVGSNHKPPPNRAQPLASRPNPGSNNTGSTKTGTDSPSILDQDPRVELTRARQALEQRDDDKFRLHITQTEYLLAQKPANADALKADETHLREIERLLNNFWQAVREGADKKIPKREKISFKRHHLEIVAKEGDQLTYKFDGVEHVTSTKKLPPRVAMYMALRVFGPENLDGKIAIVVFQLIDSEAARDSGCQRLSARLLEDIEEAGFGGNPILQREREKAVKPPEDKEQELSGPLILGSAATPDKPFDPKIGAAVANEPKKLDPMLLKEAREKFDKQFRERLLVAADNPAEAKTLLNDLTNAVATAESAEFKVKLLKEGNELAARLGDSASIVKASEQIAALGGEPAVDTQSQLFKRVNLDLPGTAQDLLTHSQAAATQAEQAGNLFAATELLTIARKAADKLNIPAEIQTVVDKLQALEKRRAGK